MNKGDFAFLIVRKPRTSKCVFKHNTMQAYYWGCQDDYLKNILSGEKHFKYVHKNGNLSGVWMMLGPFRAKSYTIMIKMGKIATPSEIENHDDDYHLRHGILSKEGKLREFAYLIDEVIELPANTTFNLQNNLFPQPLKRENHDDIIAKVRTFVENIPHRCYSLVFIL